MNPLNRLISLKSPWRLGLILVLYLCLLFLNSITVLEAQDGPVNISDKASSVGVVDHTQGQEKLKVDLADFNNLGFQAQVTPKPVQTEAISPTEGMLVSVTGLITGLTSCEGNYKFLIDDGARPATTFVFTSTTLNICRPEFSNGDAINVKLGR